MGALKCFFDEIMAVAKTVPANGAFGMGLMVFFRIKFFRNVFVKIKKEMQFE